MASSQPNQTYDLGDWKLQSGETIPKAFIAYKTFGDPKSPAIVYPTWYSGLIADNEWLIGDDMALSPKKYFIIITALFGNSQSASPSNMPDLRPFPSVTFYDNVRAQHKLVTEHFHIKHLRAVIGWSMGAGQSYQWATQYPDFMDLCIPFCGSARTSLHNGVFLEGQKSHLLGPHGQTSGGVGKGPRGDAKVRTWEESQQMVAMKGFGRGYAGWGFSQAFYREKLFAKHFNGQYPDLESFMTGFWEGWACQKDPENMLTMLLTWQNGDVSKQDPYGGDFEKAMSAIKAKTLILPAETDLYFPPEDSEYELKCMAPGVGTLKVFPTIWGHWAGGPGDSKEDVKWLNDRVQQFFDEHKAMKLEGL